MVAGGVGGRVFGGRPRRFLGGRSSEGRALGGRPRFKGAEGCDLAVDYKEYKKIKYVFL